jgi:transposase
VSIREELILKVLAKEDSVVELAHQYGVSRKTIYKWLSRTTRRDCQVSSTSRDGRSARR